MRDPLDREGPGPFGNAAPSGKGGEQPGAEEGQARLLTILENTSDLIATATPEGRLTYLNKAGRKLVGWGDDEPLGDRVIGDLHPNWALRKIKSVGLPTATSGGLWEALG